LRLTIGIEKVGAIASRYLSGLKWQYFGQAARSVFGPTAHTPQLPTPKNPIFNHTLIVITNPVTN
jgi:hypothetical protein